MSQKPFSLRITFWGVQGSCPIFPSPAEVTEFMRRVAAFTLTRTIEDLCQLKLEPNRHPAELLLGGTLSRQALETYQQRLGLPDLPVYGGDTTCLEVETSEGNLLLFDGGSGIRHCSISLLQRWRDRKERVIHFFGSHEHLDHRSGLPFASFSLVKNNPFQIKIYGPAHFLQALDAHFGMFSHQVGEITHRDDPLDFTIMTADFEGTEFHDPSGQTKIGIAKPQHWGVHDIRKPVRIGRTEITAFPIYHGKTTCLAYKIQHDGKAFVFCTDHEARKGLDPLDPRQVDSVKAEERLIQHVAGADLLYIDGQYFKSEYMGLRGIGVSPPVSRMDWGHGIIEDIIERSFRHKVKHTYIGHHDPEREWPERFQLDQELANLCQGREVHIELAKGHSVVEI